MINKQIVSLLLSLVLIMGTLSACAESTDHMQELAQPVVLVAYDDFELARAVSLGIGQHKNTNDTITYADFVKMLDVVVRLSSEERFSDWVKVLDKARRSSQTMTRREGMEEVLSA